MRTRASFCLLVLFWSSCAVTQTTARDWWREYTPLVSSPHKIKDLSVVNAGAIRAAGYFGGWYGFWDLDRQQSSGQAPPMWEKWGKTGAKRLVYFDAGEVGDYAAFFTADGKMKYTGWSIPFWKGEPVTARWFGLQAFMQNVPWAPYPTANAYQLKPLTTPSGEEAQDLYSILTQRDIDGKWEYLCFSNPNITDDVARRTGLATLSERQQAPEDVQGRTGWKTVRLVHIDHSNPQLRDYHCREIGLFVEKFKPDGFHIDNFGDVDIFRPWRSALGLWSMHTFRQYMKNHFSKEQLKDAGIDDINTFDIRAYITEKPFETRGKKWPQIKDPKWAEDLVWKCYLLNKVETDLSYHRALYETVKKADPSCAVTGNLIPLMPGAALMKGACDIANFEWQTVGTFGDLPDLGLPPKARVAYVTRLGAAIGDAGYCWPSLYVPKRLSGPGHENLHKVLAGDCLANRGLLDYGQWFLANYSPGTPESAGFVNRFVKANGPRLSGREYLADIGLVFCPWSDIAATTVWGTIPEMFVEEYTGWADYLCKTHRQWDLVLSQDIVFERLRKYPIVVLPSVMVITHEQAAELQKYVEAGGHLIATGLSGMRHGPDRYLMPRHVSILAPLTVKSNVRIVSDKPGVSYRKEDQAQTAATRMDELLSFEGVAPCLTTDAPLSVGVNLNIRDGDRAPALTLDLNNYDLNVDTDTVTPTKPCTVTIRLPEKMAAMDIKARCLSPEMSDAEKPPQVQFVQDKKKGTLTLNVPSFRYYFIIQTE